MNILIVIADKSTLMVNLYARCGVRGKQVPSRFVVGFPVADRESLAFL